MGQKKLPLKTTWNSSDQNFKNKILLLPAASITSSSITTGFEMIRPNLPEILARTSCLDVSLIDLSMTCTSNLIQETTHDKYFD